MKRDSWLGGVELLTSGAIWTWDKADARLVRRNLECSLLPVPNPIFHQFVRKRLSLLLFIGEPSFSQLKVSLSITDGNLDAHLKRLSAAGYLHSRMRLEGRPHTVYCLSESGASAFRKYVDALSAVCTIAMPPPYET